ncbi:MULTISPECIES: hypothetical protein [Bradyrhizobium]|uniref:Uncharacterized protein n=1 Tax=Bradyrhizobium septentrionale TaxID=1404411 RepID=A0A973ZY70_9BRAD|nr:MULTISPECIES: hypothetical protein [Bradyrhizobium]QIG97717.1 hypothetical protein G6P99_38805 [Bradyrhizobium sp. 6(2017)]UGY20154.1 hypothetical protein HAP48_0023485 [Bradyrhizobium septentrionale]UGY29001.1 hypothetical protein HU675_0020835 [Bradyrhizobium septentrionale]
MDEMKVLLASPSNAGLADPGHATARSLMQVSSVLNMLNPTLDNLISVKMMFQLLTEITDNFQASHDQLVREHE